MKKILLAAAFSAFASFNAFGTACTALNGSTVAQVQADITANGFCTINGWSLSTFGVGQSTQTGYTAAATTNDLLVNFNVLVSGGGGAGFSVTFSDNGATGDNYMNALTGQPNDTANFVSFFVIESGPAVQTIVSEVTGASVTPGGNNGSIQLQKIITDASQVSNPTIIDGTILTTALAQSTNPLNLWTNSGNAITRLGVVDNFQINSGNSGAATLSSYTNSFYAADPQTGVPEPMTFVLMGAGLVGVAVLRRRNS